MRFKPARDDEDHRREREGRLADGKWHSIDHRVRGHLRRPPPLSHHPFFSARRSPRPPRPPPPSSSSSRPPIRVIELRPTMKARWVGERGRRVLVLHQHCTKGVLRGEFQIVTRTPVPISQGESFFPRGNSVDGPTSYGIYAKVEPSSQRAEEEKEDVGEHSSEIAYLAKSLESERDFLRDLWLAFPYSIESDLAYSRSPRDVACDSLQMAGANCPSFTRSTSHLLCSCLTSIPICRTRIRVRRRQSALTSLTSRPSGEPLT